MILDLITGMDGMGRFYFICAVLGGFLFLVRITLMAFGGHHGVDDGGNLDTMDHAAGDSDSIFRLGSLQGMTGFLTMFGLMGMALSSREGISHLLAFVGAFLSGSLTLVAIGALTAFLMKMQSSGNVDTNNAIGKEGHIYLGIPADGTGKAQVVFQNHLKIMDAVSEDKLPIKTGERIKVVYVSGGNILVVKKI